VPSTLSREGRTLVQGRSSGFGLVLLAFPTRYPIQIPSVSGCHDRSRSQRERDSLPITAARPRWLFTTLPFSPGEIHAGHLEHDERIAMR